jgi:hypothetical protein
MRFLCFLVFLMTSPLYGALIVLNVESDSGVNSNYGTLKIEDAGVGVLDFTIDLNNIVLGQDADVHEFGFNSNYSGPLSSSGGFLVKTDSRLPGLNIKWDFVIEFGNGQPILDPVNFKLSGDPGFTQAALLNTPAEYINGWDGYFAVHAQSTSTPAGSETVFCGVNPVSTVPEPSTFAIFGLGMFFLVGTIYFRKEKIRALNER